MGLFCSPHKRDKKVSEQGAEAEVEGSILEYVTETECRKQRHYGAFLPVYAGIKPQTKINTNKAKIAYNSGNTAKTIVIPNTLCPEPMAAIPLAQT